MGFQDFRNNTDDFFGDEQYVCHIVATNHKKAPALIHSVLVSSGQNWYITPNK